jgi:hypothetical protein
MARRDERIKMARPGEPEAVRTTIVGGQPPGSGRRVGAVPRGVEVLVKKAAVDPAFKKLLMEKRAEAAEAIALKLEPAEAAMLNAVPEAQLESIVANTKVSPILRPAFVGYAAGVMLAALATTTACGDAGTSPDDPGATRGIQPDFPATAEARGKIPPAEEENAETAKVAKTEEQKRDENNLPGGSGLGTGIRPDKP